MELPEAARKLPRLLVAAQGPDSKYAACVGQQRALAEVCPPAMAVQSCPSLVQNLCQNLGMQWIRGNESEAGLPRQGRTGKCRCVKQGAATAS